MIEFIVGLIIVLFVIFLILTFFGSLFINLVLLIIFYFLITRDLKDKDNHKYYIASIFLTAIVFILSSTELINSIFTLTNKIFISTVSVAVLLVYFLANLTGIFYELLRHSKGN